MNAVERADRFTLMMPDGTSMDVAKDGLTPETVARFRASAPVGLDEGDDAEGAALQSIESELAALESDGGASIEPPVMQSLPLPLPLPVGPPTPDHRVMSDPAFLPPNAQGVVPLHPSQGGEPIFASAPLPDLRQGDLVRAEGERLAADRLKKTGTDVVPASAPRAVDPSVPDDVLAMFRTALAGSSRGGGGIGVGMPKLAPYERSKSLDDAYADQARVAGQIGLLNANDAIDRERMIEQFTADNIALNERLTAERDAEYRRQQQVYDDAYSGKIEPDRLFTRMDSGQRALSLIGLVLGGIGAGNTGVNAAVGVMERMIDRDIDAQAKDLDRKKSLFGDFLRMGYQREQARQMTKGAMLEAQAGMLARQAAKTASPMALLAAQNAQAEIKLRAEDAFSKAQAAHTGQQLQIAELRQRAAIKNAELAQSERNAKMQVAATLASRELKDREYVVPVAPFAVGGQHGVRFTAFNKEQANKVRAAGTNAENLLSILETAKRFRTDRERAWLPKWVPGGDDRTIADAIQGRLLGALNDQRNYGALDVGSQAVLKLEAIDPGAILSTDTTVQQVLDDGIEAVKQGYSSVLRGQTEEGPRAIATTYTPPGGRRAGQ